MSVFIKNKSKFFRTLNRSRKSTIQIIGTKDYLDDKDIDNLQSTYISCIYSSCLKNWWYKIFGILLPLEEVITSDFCL